MKKILQILLKATMILFVILSFALLFISIFRPEWMKIAVEWTGKLIQNLGDWNYIIAFSSALIESLPIIGSLVPWMNIMVLVGGFWGSTHIFTLLLTIICASFGAMLGNFVGFWLGKAYGNHIITNYGDWIGIGKTEQKILENQIQKNGFWYIVLGKFHGTLRAFIPFIAGASNMASRNFWIYNTIGSIIWAITINLIGVFFIQNYEVILDNIGKITTGILVAIIAYFFFFKKETLKKYWAEKIVEIEEKQKKQSQKKDTKPGKMHEKIWETNYKNMPIRVENGWSWNGFSKHKISINNDVIHEYLWPSKGTWFHKEFNVENHKIGVKIGSQWHMLGIACQIFVDDNLIFGDKILVFPGKKQ